MSEWIKDSFEVGNSDDDFIPVKGYTNESRLFGITNIDPDTGKRTLFWELYHLPTGGHIRPMDYRKCRQRDLMQEFAERISKIGDWDALDRDVLFKQLGTTNGEAARLKVSAVYQKHIKPKMKY